MAPLDSPSGPTEEMVMCPAAVGFDAFRRSAERCEVMLDSDVSGVRAGREGVSRPYFGSTPPSTLAQEGVRAVEIRKG